MSVILITWSVTPASGEITCCDKKLYIVHGTQNGDIIYKAMYNGQSFDGGGLFAVSVHGIR